ncbi:type II secretion system F family protein [Parasalinivibrio latis]|uniref:type II secretion system F family protein n=1 Tax=Parasalinivibrio latis TaxID=2952610 RepID=UPI0030E52162
MKTMVALILIAAGALLVLSRLSVNRKRVDHLSALVEVSEKIGVVDTSAVDLKSLGNVSLASRIWSYFYNASSILGENAVLKMAIFFTLGTAGAAFGALQVIPQQAMLVTLFAVPVTAMLGLKILNGMARKAFEESFPDSLNMLASAVTAGESLMHAIIFVGKSLDNIVGREFKFMGERLQIGESPDEVLRRACLRLPYPEFVFFAITLRANISRGGQLKEVITRLNRLMFDARAIEKKKLAMTSEARMSAKIVCAIPFAFLLLLKYISPENFSYIFNDSAGQQLLYYVLASEAIGMGIIYFLMRKVKS